jgi:hypothetical protein
VTCFNDVVAWATPLNIRVIHYSKKQKICLIERPKKADSFPDYLYNANATKPSIVWKREDKANVDFFHVAWYNLIKICKLKVNEAGKYQMEVLKK